MFNLDKILDKKNVNGYSEEKQKRYKNGKEVDEEVIRVYVSNKEPVSTLSAKDKIPEKINGIKTDVVELGEIKAQKNHKDKYRPALGGISIGHKDITAGTLGAVLWSSRLEKPVIISNNHVQADSNKGNIGDPIYQPGPADHERTEKTKIGKLVDFVEIAENKKNKQDSAIAEVNNLDDVKPNHIDGYGVVTGFDLKPEKNMKIRISSRTKPEISEGQVTDSSATISVNFGDFTAKFSDQILTTPMSQPGDSVNKDTMVYYKVNGTTKYDTIENLYKEYNNQKPKHNFKILTVSKNNKILGKGYPSIKNSKVVFKEISNVIDHGMKDVWKVTLNNGKEIKVTKDHSLMGFKNDKSSNTSTANPLNLEEIDSVFSCIDYTSYQGYFGQPLGVDNKLLKLAGLWMGDGSYIRGRNGIEGIYISTGNEENIVNFVEDFNGKPKSKGDYRIYDAYIGRFIYNLFGEETSKTKQVPKKIMSSSDREIRSFLKGYFSADGSIHTKGSDRVIIEAASINKDLLLRVQSLLIRLGIRNTISTGYIPSEFSDNRQYKIRIESKPYIKRFLNKVGFIKHFNDNLSGILKDQGKATKHFYNLSVHKVRNKEYVGKEKVYDVKVPNNNMFVGNNILAHNSGSLGITPKNKIVGLLFAGSQNVTVLNKIKYPKDAYGLKLFKEKESSNSLKVQLKKDKNKGTGDILFEVEDEDNKPVSGAKCKVSKGAENYSVFTDKNGKARLEDIDVKVWMYEVSKSGYQSENGFIDEGDFSNV